jgi:HSP20 family molecular chaperone IbpA
MANFMAEKKKTTADNTSKKSEIAVTAKKTPTRAKQRQKPSSLAPVTPLDLSRAFDDVFGRFRRDFEDVLFPSYWDRVMSIMPETRVPAVDLEDRGNDFLLKAEMPGFKKEDIEIEVQDNSLVITGEVGWKYDKKEQAYICKERACKTFYRMVDLPEEVKVDEVNANLVEGVLEITLPKKVAKQKRKIKVA